MNLLDELHTKLTTHGPATPHELWEQHEHRDLISPSKVHEDLNRLKTAGRAVVDKHGTWTAKP